MSSEFAFVLGTSACKIEDGQYHCLVMDEVDGMAGNEDRGGIQVINSLCVFVFSLSLSLSLSLCVCVCSNSVSSDEITIDLIISHVIFCI